MEIPPESSYAQCSALFTGYSSGDVNKKILSLTPDPGFNFLNESTNRQVAYTSTGSISDFRIDDFKEASKIFNGIQKYPYSNSAQIFNYKFDPYYFDGSENEPNFNVQENLIGTPLGTSLLEDPRLTYTKNLLLLKEYQGQEQQLNDAYIKELYMVNTEKGSTYYQNMLERQQNALDAWSRRGRSKKQPLDSIVFTYNQPQIGRPPRDKQKEQMSLPRQKRKHVQTIYSATPLVQRNFRQQQMDRLPTDERDIVNDRNVGFRSPISDLSPITPYDFGTYDTADVMPGGRGITASSSEIKRFHNMMMGSPLKLRLLDFSTEDDLDTVSSNTIVQNKVTPSPGQGFGELGEQIKLITRPTQEMKELNEKPVDAFSEQVEMTALSKETNIQNIENTLQKSRQKSMNRTEEATLDTGNSNFDQIQQFERYGTKTPSKKRDSMESGITYVETPSPIPRREITYDEVRAKYGEEFDELRNEAKRVFETTGKTVTLRGMMRMGLPIRVPGKKELQVPNSRYARVGELSRKIFHSATDQEIYEVQKFFN